MSGLSIGDRRIGSGQPALIIAEIGVNHDGSADLAIELVGHAAAAGADAVKLQVFRADTLMHDSCDFAGYQRECVAESDPAAMLRRYELSRDDLRRVIEGIQQRGLIPLATPFSPDDVDTIAELNLPAIKIASPDLVNRLLLERAAKTGKPLIISTGAATVLEIEQAAAWLRSWNAKFVFMHCVSSYPTAADQAHLRWIGELDHLGVPVGYSDHTTELLAGALAVAAGACVIEKHLTHDRNAAGPDHAASADPEQFCEYVRQIRLAQTMRGAPGKHVLPIENDVRVVSRQSLVLARDVEQGKQIEMSDLTVQRPGTGISPAQVTTTIGRVARKPLPKGTLLQWEMLSDAA
jgi:sialic acid synthase SpsE